MHDKGKPVFGNDQDSVSLESSADEDESSDVGPYAHDYQF